MKSYNVAVIGAGPAGMMAAITASGLGRSVVLIEKNPQVGRKLLATGNGRCNITNKYITADRYHGATKKFISKVLGAFDQIQTLAFFDDLGLAVKEGDNGRIFPRTNHASSVAEVLRQRLIKQRVKILLDTQVKKIEPASAWKISTLDGACVSCDNIIIATGGRASHYLGSTGDGLYWAEKLGHRLTPIYAALVPVETVENWSRHLQGVRVEASVTLMHKQQTIAESFGDVLFTRYGLSGPAVMAHAGRIAPLLGDAPVFLHINLFPEISESQLDALVKKLLASDLNRSGADALAGILPQSLIELIFERAEVECSTPCAQIDDRRRRALVHATRHLSSTVSQLRPLKEAQVTSGGIDTTEVSPETLESKLEKNLYFAGEMLDVDGDSGGFNLQWAWSSGYVAGSSAI